MGMRPPTRLADPVARPGPDPVLHPPRPAGPLRPGRARRRLGDGPAGGHGVVFTLVFSRLARVGSDGIPYPLFALARDDRWTYFASAVSRGSEALAGNPQLVTKVAFPRLAAPAAAMVPPLVDLAVSLVLVVVLLIYYRVAPAGGCWRYPAGWRSRCWSPSASVCGCAR